MQNIGYNKDFMASLSSSSTVDLTSHTGFEPGHHSDDIHSHHSDNDDDDNNNNNTLGNHDNHHPHHNTDSYTGSDIKASNDDRNNNNYRSSHNNRSSASNLEPTYFQTATHHHSGPNHFATLNSSTRLPSSGEGSGFEWSLNNGCASDHGDEGVDGDGDKLCGGQDYFICCSRKLNFRQTIGLIVGMIVLGALVGCAVGLGIYFGAIRR